jgi:hypothetical protein
MADDFEKELSKSEKLLKERLTKAGKIARDITNQAFKELLNSIDDYSNSLDNITDQLASQLQDYDKIKQSTKQFGDALKSTLPFVKDNKDLASKLTQIYSENNKLANKLVENNEDLITGQLRSQDVAKDIVKSRQTQLTIELSQRDIAQEIAQSEREIVGLQGEELEKTQFKLEALREINEQLEAEKENQQAISTNLQEQAASAAKIENKVGVGGKLLKGLKKIPVLGDILDVGGAEEAMRSAAAGGASGFKTMGAGVKALGPSLKAAMGPLALISLAVEAIQMLIGAMLDADQQVTDIAHNFNIIKEDAADTRDRFFELSDEAGKFGKIQSGNLLLQKDLVKYNMEFNEAMGTSIDLSSNLGEKGKEIAVQFANASKFLKLGADEQKGLIESTSITGQNIDETKTSILGTVRLRKLESGILFDERKILKDVLTANNAIKLSVKGGSEGLTNAAIAAAKLGSTLNGVAGISKNLLNFEDSISSELEAELLLGRDINLEKARQYALEGNIEGVANEINKQVGSAADYSRMNVIQQEALAKAMGTSREELADMLVKQESLNNLKGTFAALSKEQLETMKTAGKIDEATFKNLSEGKASASEYYESLKKAGLSTEELTTQLGAASLKALESQSAQDKFNDTLEKVKESFSRAFTGETIDKFANLLADFIKRWSEDGLFSAIFSSGGTEEKKKQVADATSGKQGAEQRKTMVIMERAERTGESGVNTTREIGGIAKGGIIPSGYPNDTFPARLSSGEAVVPLDGFYSKLDILISAVEKGGNIYLETDKVGTAHNKSTFKLNK